MVVARGIERSKKENKMRRLIVTLMVMAIGGVASANLVVNGSFEQTFSDGYAQTVDPAVDGSFAYGQVAGVVYMPAWGADQSGYAVNPDGGLNQFGLDGNPATASDGNVAYGAGHPSHYFNIWQNVTANGSGVADGTQDYKLTFDFYHSSAIAGNWLTAKSQMLDGPLGYMEASRGGVGVDPGVPMDSWQTVELTFPANAGFDGSQIQVYLQGSGGSFVDNVALVPEPATLGMVALLGGGILWIRKRFMI